MHAILEKRKQVFINCLDAFKLIAVLKFSVVNIEQTHHLWEVLSTLWEVLLSHWEVLLSLLTPRWEMGMVIEQPPLVTTS